MFKISTLYCIHFYDLVSPTKPYREQPCLYFGPTQNTVLTYLPQGLFHIRNRFLENETISHPSSLVNSTKTLQTQPPRVLCQFHPLGIDACKLGMFSRSCDSVPRRQGPLDIRGRGFPNNTASLWTRCSHLGEKKVFKSIES